MWAFLIVFPRERPCTWNRTLPLPPPQKNLVIFKTAVWPQRPCQWARSQRQFPFKSSIFLGIFWLPLSIPEGQTGNLEESASTRKAQMAAINFFLNAILLPKSLKANRISAHTTHYLKCPKTLQQWWFWIPGHSSNIAFGHSYDYKNAWSWPLL